MINDNVFLEKTMKLTLSFVLTEKMSTAISEGNIVLGRFFFDFSKALDTVDHSILPNTLYKHGIESLQTGLVIVFRREQYHWCVSKSIL